MIYISASPSCHKAFGIAAMTSVAQALRTPISIKAWYGHILHNHKFQYMGLGVCSVLVRVE